MIVDNFILDEVNVIKTHKNLEFSQSIVPKH